MLHGTGPIQCDPAAVPDSLGLCDSRARAPSVHSAPGAEACLAALARDQHSQTSLWIGKLNAIAFECVAQPDKRCGAGVCEHFP